MPQLKTYDLFISHSWDYNDEYHRMVNLFDQAPNFKWRNYSVPDHDPLTGGSDRKLEAELDKQIRPVNAVIILAGMYVPRRDWILREISIAEGYGKPMIGVKPWGNEAIPQIVQSKCKAIVNWQTASIVDAIRKHAL